MRPLEVQVPRDGQRLPNFPKLAPRTHKTYALMIEPKGHTRRVRAQSRNEVHHSRDLLQLPNIDREREDSRANEAMSAVLQGGIDKRERYYEKARLRKHHVQRFEVDRRFPALVTSQLTDLWRREAGGNESSESPGAPGPKQRLAEPTVAAAMKLQVKRPPASATEERWLAAGAAGVVEVWQKCARVPVLHQSDYDPVSIQQRGYNEKKRWVGNTTILPTSAAGAKATCEFNRQAIEADIAITRSRGRTNNTALQERYQSQREAFKRDVEQRGAISRFELRALQAQALEQKDYLDYPVPSVLKPSPKERRSTAFSRFDISKFVVPSQQCGQ